MKVILIQHIENLGAKGDLVNVKRGYARNYLIPKNMAIYATPYNMKQLDAIRNKASEEEAIRLNELKEIARKMSGITLSFVRKTDENDKLYGSVSETDILNALSEQGIHIHKSTINLEKHIKELGAFTVAIKLHNDIETSLNLEVQKETQTPIEPEVALPEPEVAETAVEESLPAEETMEEPAENQE